MVGVELSPVPVATVEDQFRPGSPDAMDLSLLTPIRLLGSLRRTPHRFIPANAKKEMARQVQPPCVFPFFERKRETIGQRRNERGGAIEGPDLFDFPASLFATFFQKRLGKMTHVLALTEIWDQLETGETPFEQVEAQQFFELPESEFQLAKGEGIARERNGLRIAVRSDNVCGVLREE